MGLHIGNYYRPANVDCMKTRGERIRDLRLAKGWNQTQLAEEVKVDQSSVSDWEKRNAWPGEKQLPKLAEVLGVTIELLVTGKDDRVWPFPNVPIERFLALDDHGRGYVEGELAAAIRYCESNALRKASPVRDITPARKNSRRA